MEPSTSLPPPSSRPYPTPPALTRERRLSIVLRQPGDDDPGAGHTGGVGALLLVAGTGGGPTPPALFSGSRDASVRGWATSGEAASALSVAPASCWRGHAAWVNALACPGGGVVASGSSDRTIKLWRRREDGGGEGGGAEGTGTGTSASTSSSGLLATLAAHGDYVTCLAASPAGAPGRLASAGLGAQVLVWDVGAAVVAGAVEVGGGDGGGSGLHRPPPPSAPWAPPALEAAAARESVYALAMDGTGTLIAAGGPSGALRLADARTGAPAAALRGHAPGAVVRAVALSPDGRRALSGASDRAVRLWDVGTRRCIAVLAVHTDSVWAVAVEEERRAGGEGGRAGSGAPPSDPALPWGERFLSGGRDGRAYRTDARARSAVLVCEGAEPVTALALDAGAGVVWVGRERAGGVEGWAVPAVPPAASQHPARGGEGVCVASPTAAAAAAAVAAGGGRPACLPPGGAFPVSASPLVRARQAFSGEGGGGGGGPGSAPPPPRSAPLPASTAPLALAAGAPAPPITAATVLPDRRHVLTQSLDGRVEEWDVAAGRVVAVRAPAGAPPAALAAAARGRWTPAAVPPWFTADASSGRLALVLAPPTCFTCEVYAGDLGAWARATAPDDLKVNAGQELLRAALSAWVAGRALAHEHEHDHARGGEGSHHGSGGGEGAPMGDGTPPPPPAPLYFRLAGAVVVVGGGGGGVGGGGGEGGEEEEETRAAPGPGGAGGLVATPPPLPPALLIGEGGDPAGLPWVAPISTLTGAEPSPSLIPAWAVDAVLRGRLAGERGGGGGGASQRDAAKVAFTLRPAPGSGLPALTPVRLSAPRVLPLRKVAAYAASKLGEAGMEVAPLASFWEEGAQAAADAALEGETAAALAAGAPPPARLELTINGLAAPHDLSLAAAAAHLWRRGEDLPLTYCLVVGGVGRAARPVLRPPNE